MSSGDTVAKFFPYDNEWRAPCTNTSRITTRTGMPFRGLVSGRRIGCRGWGERMWQLDRRDLSEIRERVAGALSEFDPAKKIRGQVDWRHLSREDRLRFFDMADMVLEELGVSNAK